MAGQSIVIAFAAFAGLVVVAAAFLKAWSGWLQLKARELDIHRTATEGGAPACMARIEIADLKERIRKLEAIASGVDL
jgi:hypothetical protein